MTQEQLLDLGITLVGALKANAYKCSLEDGIFMALEGTDTNFISSEELAEIQAGGEAAERRIRIMEVERKLLHDQALALANAAVDYLAKNEKPCEPIASLTL